MYARQRIGSAVAIGALTLTLAACGGGSSGGSPNASGGATSPSTGSSSSSGASTDFSLAFANLTNAAALEVGINDSVVSSAKTLGVSLTKYDNQSSPTTALTNAQLMVNQKPDVIAEFAAAANSNQSIGAMFTKAGIPCLGVDIPVPGCATFGVDHSLLGQAMGEAVGEIAKAKGWTGSNTTVVLATSWAVGGAEVNSAEQAFYVAFAKAVPGMQAVAASQITASTTAIGQDLLQVNMNDVTPSVAFNAMTSALPRLPSSRNLVVFGINDDVITGALRALSNAGRSSHTLVAADGASTAGLQGLQTNPIWVAEGSEFTDSWGEFILALATALHNNVQVPDTTLVPIAAVTKANVDTYYTSTGATKFLPALPAADDYLKSLGVLQQFHNITGLT
jgi:ribose transport system substrate-binding protein